MVWFPIGPDFVSVPRDSTAAARLSRRNELPRQTMVHSVDGDGVEIDILSPALHQAAADRRRFLGRR